MGDLIDELQERFSREITEAVDAELIANMPMQHNLRYGELQPTGRANPRQRFGYINAGGINERARSTMGLAPVVTANTREAAY
ncbi:MAG: hypothetical protein VX745_08955 [Pseudomonadota bacterium]|nr:hypothetical protein [Pseudomonadota bacterium]